MATLPATLLVALLALSFIACGGRSSLSPPPPVASEWFFVGNFSGNVTGFSAASGRLQPIPGSSVTFPSATFPLGITNFAVKPDGTLLAVIIGTAQTGASFQVATIASGGGISLSSLTSPSSNPGGIALSSKGMLAVTDTGTSNVQLWTIQNNQLSLGGSAATGALPQDLTFSADGKTLYVGNDGDGTVSVFSVSDTGTLQLLQTARLYAPSPGGFGNAIVRVRLSPAGNKFAATTADGVLYVADVSAVDQTLANIQRIDVVNFANLEDVIFDPSETNLYTGDQDNGGILGFSIAGGTVAPLPNSPFSTGTLPGGALSALAPARLVPGSRSNPLAPSRCDASPGSAAADRSGPAAPGSARPDDRLSCDSPRSSARCAHAPRSPRAPTRSTAG